MGRKNWQTRYERFAAYSLHADGPGTSGTDNPFAEVNEMRTEGNSPERAIAKLCEAFSDNPWFINLHWPENEHRVRTMMADVSVSFPDGGRVLDVGCYSGYVSLLMAWSGYQVIGTDMEDFAVRTRLFAEHGVDFHETNLNDLNPFAFLPRASVDVVLLGEVIEHVLNYPLGLLRSLGSALRPGGLLILSTPNPSNVMNAVRVLRGLPLLWGTEPFVAEQKFDGRGMICRADIHYREYTTSEMRYLLGAAGFEIETLRYMGMGVSPQQPALKRFMKNNALIKRLMSRRLFTCTQYFVARKRSGA